MRDCYDRQGKPITDVLEYGRLMQDRTYQSLAKTTVRSGPTSYTVSTVWLGLDHSMARFLDEEGHRPLIFETMVFEDKRVHAKVPAMPEYNIGEHEYTYKPSIDGLTRRYSTEEEALAGHKQVVAEVKLRAEKPPQD